MNAFRMTKVQSAAHIIYENTIYFAYPRFVLTFRSIQNLRIKGHTMRLLQLSSTDIFISHDWPQGIEHHGDLDDLLRRKPFFRRDIESGNLGSPPGMQLLRKLKPHWWLSAHLHCRFEATVVHGSEQGLSLSLLSCSLRALRLYIAVTKGGNPDEITIDDFDESESSNNGTDQHKPEITSEAKEPRPDINPDEILLNEEFEDISQFSSASSRTKFLALDKCLPRRQFLEVREHFLPLSTTWLTYICQVIDVPTKEFSGTPLMTFDPEWLAITRAFHPHLSTNRTQPRLPDERQSKDMITKELDWVLHNVGEKQDGIVNVTDVQTFWPTAPGSGDQTRKSAQR